MGELAMIIRTKTQPGKREEVQRLYRESLVPRAECRSPALPGPVRGEDRYRIKAGRITRLDVRMADPSE